jgi:ribosomal protein L12E/L44/L45/RPP1/RPP2
MTVTIELTPEEEATLRAKAAAAGLDVPTHVREAVIARLNRRSLMDAMRPLQQAFAGAGVTEAEADEIIARGRREYHEERRRKGLP